MTASFTRKRLYRVGSCPLERAVDDVKQLAEAVWYRGYQPKQAELELLRGVMPREDFQRALCVLELLSQYPVCRRIPLDICNSSPDIFISNCWETTTHPPKVAILPASDGD